VLAATRRLSAVASCVDGLAIDILGLFSGFACLAFKLPTQSNPIKIMNEYLDMVDLLNTVFRFSDDYLFYFAKPKIFPGGEIYSLQMCRRFIN
jgi:hypothetical protein